MSKPRFFVAAALSLLCLSAALACQQKHGSDCAVVPAPFDTTTCPPAAEPVPEGGLAWKTESVSPDADTSGDMFPLRSIEVTTRVSGPVALVKVHQVFGNRSKVPSEAVYMFPLPHKSAVRAMVMRTRDRVVRAQIQRRDDARRTYEDAARQGRQASLLEQERDDIFTQSVANIMPGDTIGVDIELAMPLAHVGGWTEFVFPTVVGPRFCPPGKVPDMGRIGAPRLPPGMKPPQRLAISVALEPGFPVLALESPTHCLRMSGSSTGAGTWNGPVSVQLKPGGDIPNRDFVLRWKTRQAQASATVLTDKEGAEGHFLVEIQPPAVPGADNSTPKELVFLVDQSGSMGGQPLDLVKAAMRKALEGMEPRDRFQIIGFSNTTRSFAKAPVPASERNIREGIAWVEALEADGGTMMLDGLREAFAVPVSKGALRIIAMMTDGYVGNEPEIVSFVRSSMDSETRAFGFGVGSSVNRSFLDDYAKAGKGATEYVTLHEAPDSAVARFEGRIRRPVLTGIRLTWHGIDAQAVLPDPVPDLFDGDGLLVTGRFRGAARGSLTVEGKVNGQKLVLDVPVDLSAATPRPEIGSLWARSRIAQIVETSGEWPAPDSVEAITQVALRYRLMSKYTSFVAVDDSVVNQSGQMVKRQVPLPLPDGVSPSALGGGADQMIGSPSEGGATEMRSVAWAPSSPQATMSNSVMDRVMAVDESSSGGDRMAGFGDKRLLAGGGGSISRQSKMGGVGLGTAGPSGFGGGQASSARARITPPKPSDIELGGETVSRSPESILRVIRAHLGGIQYTFQKHLRRDSTLGGKISLKFTIAPSGDIIAITVVSSNTGSAVLDQEILDKARRMKFDTVERGNTTVTYQFVLDRLSGNP